LPLLPVVPVELDMYLEPNFHAAAASRTMKATTTIQKKAECPCDPSGAVVVVCAPAVAGSRWFTMTAPSRMLVGDTALVTSLCRTGVPGGADRDGIGTASRNRTKRKTAKERMRRIVGLPK